MTRNRSITPGQHDEWIESRAYISADNLAKSRLTLIEGDASESTTETINDYAETA